MNFNLRRNILLPKLQATDEKFTQLTNNVGHCCVTEIHFRFHFVLKFWQKLYGRREHT